VQVDSAERSTVTEEIIIKEFLDCYVINKQNYHHSNTSDVFNFASNHLPEIKTSKG